MTSAIAILTYRRIGALQTMLEGIQAHCPYPVAIFEDCGLADATSEYLSRTPGTRREDMMAFEHQFAPSIQAFVGQRNLGVSGNSNRAIKWFMDGGWDHLCLCNDDLHVLGDFAKFYAQAHEDIGPGCFCFNDFAEWPSHRWIIARSRGYRVKVFSQMTGIMMSLLRRTVNKVGYFDTRFGKFGQEHCDYTNRIRFAKEMQIDGLDQACLDVEPTLADGSAGPPVLRHQNVPTSVQGIERERENKLADQRIREAAERYATEHYYRPFSLVWPTVVGGVDDRGIKVEDIPKYARVTCS